MQYYILYTIVNDATGTINEMIIKQKPMSKWKTEKNQFLSDDFLYSAEKLAE